METLRKDIDYTLVTMSRNRGSAAALFTLALGIGATTAVFSGVYGVLLRPAALSFGRAAGRLSEEHPGASSPLRTPMLSNLTCYAWSESPRTLEAIGHSPRLRRDAAGCGAQRAGIHDASPLSPRRCLSPCWRA